MSTTGLQERMAEAVDRLAAVCADLDPEHVDVDEVAGVHSLLVRAERLTAGAQLRLARRLHDVSPAAGAVGGLPGWLAGRSGTTLTEARRRLVMSEDLRGQHHLDAALQAGAVSTAQAGTIHAAIVADPDAEADLVGTAASGECDLADLRRRARRVIADADPDADATRARHHRRRGMRTWTAADGEWHARLSGPADAGAEIMAAIRAAGDEAFAAARREGRRDGADAYAFDGLLATLTRPSAARPGRQTARERKIIAVVDAAALRRGHLIPGDRCEIDGVGPVSLSAITDLLGSATVALLFRAGTTDLAVAHLGRQPTAFQRTAVEARGYVCAVVGCGATRNLEIDHTRDWALSRRTRVGDLDWLCGPHHRAKSRGHLSLTGPPGRRRPVPP